MKSVFRKASNVAFMLLGVPLILIALYVYVYVSLTVKVYMNKLIFNMKILLSKLPTDLKRDLINGYDERLTRVLDDLNPISLVLFVVKDFLAKSSEESV